MTQRTMSIVNVTGNWTVTIAALSVSIFSTVEPALRVILLLGSIGLTAIQIRKAWKRRNGK